MKMKRQISLWAAIMLVAAMVAGCGSTSASTNTADTPKDDTDSTVSAPAEESKGSDEDIVISGICFVNEESGRKWLDYVTDLYEKAHPNVKVELESLSDADYYALLRSKISSGDVPDIIQIQSYAKNAEVIDAGICYDLSKEPWLKENVQENAINALTTEDGAVYALPISLNIMCVTYNKDVFEKAGIESVPKTYDEFLEDCQKIQALGIPAILGGYQEKSGIYSDELNDAIHTTVANDRNNRIELAEGKTTWQEDKAKYSGVLERWAQRLPYYNDDLFGTDWNTVQNMLATGEGGMTINGSWAYGGVKSINPDCNIGIFPLPVSNDPNDAKLLAASSLGGFCVNQNSEHAKEALEFLEMMSTPESGEAFMEYNMNITTCKNTTVSEDSYVNDFMEYVNAGEVFDWSGYNELFADDELQNIWVTCVSKFIMDKNHDVDACLKDLDEQFAAALSKK